EREEELVWRAQTIGEASRSLLPKQSQERGRLPEQRQEREKDAERLRGGIGAASWSLLSKRGRKPDQRRKREREKDTPQRREGRGEGRGGEGEALTHAGHEAQHDDKHVTRCSSGRGERGCVGAEMDDGD
ncbi:hypothetical protein ACLOJK_027332, partial [Asimina triloba]